MSAIKTHRCWRDFSRDFPTTFETALFTVLVIVTTAALCPASTSSPGPEEPQTCAAIRLLIEQGRYPEAETAARELLNSAEAANGPASSTAADARDLAVEALIANGKARAPATRSLAERAVANRTGINGEEHLKTAAGLTNFGVILKEHEDFDAAVDMLQRALKIREQALGPDHIEVARTLNQLASVYYRKRETNTSIALFERALAIFENTPGPTHPGAAISLVGLGTLKSSQDNNAEVSVLLENAVAIHEQSLGSEHPLTADSLRALARVRQRKGDYQEAEKLLRRALSITENSLGYEHVRTGLLLNSLATLLRIQGNYVEARHLYERALAIWTTSLEPNDPWISGILNNLANVHQNMADYVAARVYLERALAMREHAFGPDHPAVAQSLNNLAIVLNEMDQQREAIPLLRRAVRINEEAYGSESIKYAKNLNNLGEALRMIDELDAAEPLLRRALNILESALGEQHHQVANQINNLALLSYQRGDLDTARLGFERAVEIWEANGGREHPLVARSVYNLAKVVVDLGEIDKGVDLALGAEQSVRTHFRLTAPSLSEREALNFAEFLRVELDLLINLAQRCSDCSANVWDSLIRSRGLVLNELAQRRRAAATADPETAALLDELKRACDRLAKLSVRGPGRDSPESYKEQLTTARRDVEKIERALGIASAAIGPDQLRSKIGFDQVVKALPSSGCLVGFARCSAFGNPVGPLKPQTYNYIALVYRPGSIGPDVVSIGPASEIDGLVREWQSATVGQGKRSESSYRLAGDALRKRIWDPLIDLLGDPEIVFIVPDGSLNLVNLAALPVGQNEYLVEHTPMIHILSEERDLVIATATGGKNIPRLLALGDPNFDSRPKRIADAHGSLPADASYHSEISPCGEPARISHQLPAAAGDAPHPAAFSPIGVLDGLPSTTARPSGRKRHWEQHLPALATKPGEICGLEGVRFRPLPSTASETAGIVTLWNQRFGQTASPGLPVDGLNTAFRLTGAEATEAEFKRLAPGKTVLHVATHGFVLDGTCRYRPSTSRGIGGLTPSQPRTTAPSEVPANPLRLSGLALAGANHRADSAAGEEDGVLTALEIANLDLSTVEWAVLSACDSGVGESISGEGVFGFRRAFRIAGARTVIMSLWPVEDRSGLEWMEALYQGRLLHDMSTAEAVRHASLTCLQARRDRNESTHPFYWGAFVAAGDWR